MKELIDLNVGVNLDLITPEAIDELSGRIRHIVYKCFCEYQRDKQESIDRLVNFCHTGK